MPPYTKPPQRGNYQALSESEQDADIKDDTNIYKLGSDRANNLLSSVSLSWLYLILSAFAGFVLAIVLVNVFPGTAPDQQFGNAKLREFLRVPRHSVVFQPNEMYSSPPNRENNAAWDELLGPSIGLIALNDSQAYGLPPGAKAVNDNRAEVYQVTFAHQLQCLSLIRTIYFSENKGIFNTTTHEPSPVVQQANACFDFLVQSIKCNADMTLESKTDEGGNFRGWDEERSCKRWEKVMQFMQVNEYKEAEKAVDKHAHGHDDDDDDDR